MPPTDTQRSQPWEPDLATGEPSLVARLLRLGIVVDDALDRVTGASGVSLADYLVLGVVRRSPSGRTTPTRICEVLRRTTGGMTPTLDRLAAAGWLTRAADPEDRRRVVIELTDAGHELTVAVNAELHRWEDDLAIAGPERTAIDEHLDLLLDVLTR